MKPYCIASPEMFYGHNLVSGGIRVMWGLYGWLLAKGQIVYMNKYPDGDKIAIYPEIYHGNPMNARTVVRYILNKPGVMGKGTPGTNTFVPGPTEFEPTDRIYVFSKIYDVFGVEPDHIMFLPVINTFLFKDQYKNRTKTCYIIGKGVNQHKHPEDAIELHRDLSMDQGKLADLLNECHTLYCYDQVTAMMEVARLCGCKVRYYGDFTKEQLSLYEPGLDGVSFEGEDNELHTSLFTEHYHEMVKTFESRLNIFIEDTQK